MEKKRWTNIHVAQGFSVKTKFKKAMTLEEAREYGRQEEKETGYLKYLGVFGVDVTTKELNRIRKDGFDLGRSIESTESAQAE